MSPASLHQLQPLPLRRAPLATEVGVVRWTGRSALSVATESALSRFRTSGAHQTRVSAMRGAATRACRDAEPRSGTGTGVITQRRRVPEAPPLGG